MNRAQARRSYCVRGARSSISNFWWTIAALASTPASRARRMLEASAAAVLVALSAVATVFVAPGRRAGGAAIQLAVIAVGTQHDLLAATHAQEQAG